ncbi:hypothetical protein C2G38_2160165 [Gigaspora rosea]|uniref:Uncharacterized protein n=1 Tax=Gigaspora rosea TaxID=44941 RepID=A0A397VYF8_9GLOM|nr:hypothetical protein C2G38_2160165 [Gigaspora rosea]
MTLLRDGPYAYHDDLGGLYYTCNEYGYGVFEELEELNQLIDKLDFLRRHLNRNYEKELQVNCLGCTYHTETLEHCLLYAFGDCSEQYTSNCKNCNKISKLFDELIKKILQNIEFIIENRKKLQYYISHQAHKMYLNTQLNAQLLSLDNEAAIMIPTSNELQVQVKILSDNGGHYHCAELMSKIINWNSWYGIEVRSWTFLEAGEDKTTVDSHHAQIAHSIRRYVRLGYSINEEDDIEKAIKDIRRTTVANIKLDRKNTNKNKPKLSGISNWYQFKYLIEGEFADFLCAQPLSHFGKWKNISLAEIYKSMKEEELKQPNPEVSTCTNPNSQWIIPIPLLEAQQVASTSNFHRKNIITIPEIQKSTNKQMLSLGKENQLETRPEYFCIGWALKEMQEYEKHGRRKHMTAHIIELLKSFFHTGDIDKSEWYTAKDMLDMLEKKAEVGKLEISEVPKVKTIENWIGHYAQQYKKSVS